MHILCVDDDKRFLPSMVRRIAERGHTVDEAIDYRTALELFSRNRFRYDMVVTDLDLGAGDQQDGEHLAQAIIEICETGGYQAPPKIICLTGARSKIDANLRNRLEDRNCVYILKGTQQYLLEVQAAALRIEEERKKGPTLLFRHHPAYEYQWDDRRSWDCTTGEDVEGVYILYSGRLRRIRLARAPRLVLDCLARHAWRRLTYSAEEVASKMALSDFYSYWSPEASFTRDSVKNNVLRIRSALHETFQSAQLPFASKDVLVTDDDRGEMVLDKIDGYRLAARVIVEHIP
jgi:CheY-like chemotaxis protein